MRPELKESFPISHISHHFVLTFFFKLLFKIVSQGVLPPLPHTKNRQDFPFPLTFLRFPFFPSKLIYSVSPGAEVN